MGKHCHLRYRNRGNNQAKNKVRVISQQIYIRRMGDTITGSLSIKKLVEHRAGLSDNIEPSCKRY